MREGERECMKEREKVEVEIETERKDKEIKSLN